MFRLHVKAYVKTRDYVQKHNVKVAMEVRQENVWMCRQEDESGSEDGDERGWGWGRGRGLVG